MYKKRISKEDFYGNGGMNNRNQYRIMISGKWFYYFYK